jgi:ATP/maltotriose-dependent transcriptional regulator MalT
MPRPAESTVPLSFTTFGDLLKHLRRRAGLTQREVAIEVGYSEVYISRLESNQRAPDSSTLLALFVPALGIQGEPELVARLLELGEASRGERAAIANAAPAPADARATLEAIPPTPPYEVVREAALAWLRERLAAERAIAICAMAGMGKTALAATLAREQAAARPVLWMTLTAGVNASVEATVRRIAFFLLAHGQQQVAPLIRQIDSPAQPISLNQQLASIGMALAQLDAAGQAPLLCIDNIHLAVDDPALMQLLRHLATATPALMLLTSRTDVPLPGVAVVRLGGLERAEGLRLIGRLGGGLALELAERLLDKTGGSPMLLRLAIGYLNDSRGDPTSAIERLEHAPHIAAYLLDTLLAHLAPRTLRVLALLALFRKPIDLELLTRIDLAGVADSRDDFSSALAELRRWHLIDNPAQLSLQPLIRDQIVATLTPDMRQRRLLHRVAAVWYEQLGTDTLETAYHYACADELEAALEVLTDRRSLLPSRGQAYAAVEIIDDLLARTRRRPGDQTSTIRQLMLIRGDLLVGTLRATEAETSYRQALAAATQPTLRAFITQHLADSLALRGQASEALRLCGEARAALCASDTLLLAQIASTESRANLTLGEHDTALRCAEQALALADQLAEVLPHRAAALQARTRLAIGSILQVQQQFSAALTQFQSGIAAVRYAGVPALESEYDLAIGSLLFAQSDLSAALVWCDETLPRLHARGEALAAGRLLGLRAFCQLYRGQLATALAAIDQSRAIAEITGDDYGLNIAQIRRSRILIAMGRSAEARQVIERALAVDASAGGQRDLGYLLDRLAMIEMIERDAIAAQATLRRALALTTADDDIKLRADLCHDLAVATLMSGAVAKAQQLLTDPPRTSDVPTDYERQLIQAVILLISGDAPAASSIAEAVAARARASGYDLFGVIASQVLAAIAAPPPLADLGRLLWVMGAGLAAQ